MKITLLCKNFGSINRGVESWSKNLQERIPGMSIVSGNQNCLNPFKWPNADIYISTGGRFEVVLCRLYTWLVHKPLVVFGHSGPGADDKWNLLCCPNVFVSFTNYQMEWANKHKLTWTKTKVINHAVDTNKFFPKKTSNNNVVLCVAANSPAKRVNLVKAAIKLLPDKKLNVYGSGQAQEVEYDLMPKVFQAANVFCFVPESYEAFGLVFLEALASNLPVVTVDDSIRREIVGQAGIFVKNPSNANELASAISEAFKQNWKQIPREQAEKFSWAVITEKYTEFFNSL